jgi:hypothetical protein
MTNDECDDGRPWGYMAGDVWRPLPKTPLLLAGLGPPPFSIILPTGQVRLIVHRPDEDSDKETV